MLKNVTFSELNKFCHLINMHKTILGSCQVSKMHSLCFFLFKIVLENIDKKRIFRNLSVFFESTGKYLEFL